MAINSSDLAKRVLPITANFSTYVGKDGVKFDEAKLKAAGLVTSMTVVIPMLHKDDFKDNRSVGAAVTRLLGEWEKARDLVIKKDNKVLGKDGTEYTLADPTADVESKEKLLVFLFDAIQSGITLAHQQVMGQKMRSDAKDKLGAPSGGASRGKRADVEV